MYLTLLLCLNELIWIILVLNFRDNSNLEKYKIISILLIGILIKIIILLTTKLIEEKREVKRLKNNGMKN